MPVVTDSKIAVAASHKSAALFTVSALSLAANIAVITFQLYVMRTRHRNPLKQEIYPHLRVFQQVVAKLLTADAAPPAPQPEKTPVGV